MALRLAQKPPRKAPPPKPRQEQPSKKKEEEEDDGFKPCAEIPDEKETKYDPNIGAVVEVDEERPHNRYPSCDSTTRVAKCVYCEKIKDKASMRCLGQNWHERGSLRYVWACRGCNSLNPSWKKISKQYKYPAWLQRMWNYDLSKNKPIKHPEEVEKAVGRQIVEKKLEEVHKKIGTAIDKKKPLLSKQTMKALSERKQKEREEDKKRFVEKFAKPKKEKVDDGKQLRSADAKLPRWKRKGRSAKVRR